MTYKQAETIKVLKEENRRLKRRIRELNVIVRMVRKLKLSDNQ